MATGQPNWQAAIRAAAEGRARPHPKPMRSRKLPIRDGHHNHTDDASDDGGHHHQDVNQKIIDHNVRLNVLEAHMQAHHGGDGGGDGKS